MMTDIEELVNEHHKMLYFYVLALVGEHHLAEDLTQDSFAVAHRKLQAEMELGNPAAWLRAIAKRLVWEAFRKRQRAPLFLSEAVVQRIDEMQTREDGSPPSLLEALEICCKRLKVRAQRIIEMRYSEGMNAIQIAKALGKTQTSVNMVLSRIRGALRECLSEEEEAT